MTRAEIPIVVLCGGRGILLRGSDKVQAKALVEINGSPIIEKVLRFYANAGFRRFLLACGAEHLEISDWVKSFALKSPELKITTHDTGAEASTGQRLWLLKNELQSLSHAGKCSD